MIVQYSHIFAEKDMKKHVNLALGLALAAITILIVAMLIFIACSPLPVVWAVKMVLNPSAHKNVAGYEEIAAQVEVVKNREYPSEYGKNKYDVYLPKTAQERLPTILWVHGGAFVTGTKEETENYAVMLANEGYAVVCMDYEWVPDIVYPGQAMQVHECFAELERVKDTYHLDIDHLILAGDSAGAYIAAQAALISTNSEYAQLLNVESTIPAENLKAMLLYCGVYDASDLIDTGNKLFDFCASRLGWALFGDRNWAEGDAAKTSAIEDYVTVQFPPSFITDGNDGSFESQSRGFATKLDHIGVRTEALFFDKEEFGSVEHEFQFDIGDGADGTLCYQKTLAFLKEQLT